jgi:hypothetical protein
MGRMTIWPYWWSWDLEFGDHAQFAMSKRLVSETEVRAMLEDATDLAPDKEPGRWMALTPFQGRPWHVILEPAFSDEVLVVVTVYMVQPL